MAEGTLQLHQNATPIAHLTKKHLNETIKRSLHNTRKTAMGMVFDDKDPVEKRIDKVSNAIEGRLNNALNEEGKVDLSMLGTTDAELRDVLSSFSESKTWRDDPKATARDVAKLLEARSQRTPLGEALEKLSKSLDR